MLKYILRYQIARSIYSAPDIIYFIVFCIGVYAFCQVVGPTVILITLGGVSICIGLIYIVLYFADKLLKHYLMRYINKMASILSRVGSHKG